MNKNTLTDKFSSYQSKYLHKNSIKKLSRNEMVNQNATWLQTMEPIKYAKFRSKNYYEIEDITIKSSEFKSFKNQLFLNLKEQISEKKELIKNIFLKNSDGSLNVGLNVILIDSLLKVIFKNLFFSIFKHNLYNFSIVAVGGYGRGELAPHSDLDLLFLLPEKKSKVDINNIEKVIQALLYLLWDLGYTVGHSTRTISDCIKKSKSETTIATALLEKRFIEGNKQLYENLNKKFDVYLKNTKTLDFVSSKLRESDLRHKRFGESRYVVEPNVKDGKGGLRDLHTLIWISKFAYQVDSISKLINIGALAKDEASSFAEAQRFLISVRCHLHYRANREDDRLAMDAQLEIAEKMNFKNTLTHKNVERFMKRYFLATKTVGNLTRIFCASIETELKKPLRLNFLSFKKRNYIEPFTLELGRLYANHKNVFIEKPTNIIKLFYISHEKNIDIHPKTLRQINSLRRLVNTKIREDLGANNMFLKILASNKDPTRTLRLMNESSILGQFIPEFQKIVGLMQFDMYHSYTVDEHTIFTIANLHALRNGELKEFNTLIDNKTLEIKFSRSLFVAMLLHDIAKGKKGDHSENGALIALSVSPRLGLNKIETKMVEWLVLNHLLMSKTAFRYELDDEKVIINFVKTVGSINKLNALLALTFADIKGVGPDVWNDWKGALIKELYVKALEILKSKQSVSKSLDQKKKSKNLLKRYLLKKEISEEEINIYCEKFYKNYWGMFNLSTVINHYEIFKKMKNSLNKFEIDITNDTRLNASELLVIAPDHHGLFSRISGLVASSGYDIVSAKILTRSDGYALDTFFIQNKDKKPILEDRSKKKLLKTIADGLKGNYNIERALKVRWHEIPARFRAVRVPVRVIFDNNSSDDYSILEIKCKNAPGVLYIITKIIASLGLQIKTANISSYGDRVVDIFYIKNVFGQKVDDDLTMDKVKKSITENLDYPELGLKIKKS